MQTTRHNIDSGTFMLFARVFWLMCSTFYASDGQTYPVEWHGHAIYLQGQSAGGTLILVAAPRRGVRSWVTVTNAVGEDAATVAFRIAKAAKASPSCFTGDDRVLESQSNTLHILGSEGSFAFAGTEKGLGIPLPPTSVSGRYDPVSDEIRLFWDDPEYGYYDEIGIGCNGMGRGNLKTKDRSLILSHVSGPGSSVGDPTNADLWVIGYRKGVPSNAGSIHIGNQSQDELFCGPFSFGIAPNWSTWSNNVVGASVCFSQGTRDDVAQGRSYSDPMEKPFYQVISASGTNFTVGTWRAFMGLLPRHTYRVVALVSTLESLPSTNWTFSVHAAHIARLGGHFGRITVDQMAGLAPLLDGSTGPQAGLMAEYGAVTTKGEWSYISTEKSQSGERGKNIKVPLGVDTIIVWTRLSGKDVSVPGVGLGWVAVQEVTEPSAGDNR